ncbi:hypothetical protein [Treponema pectinovorum]|uniref:hypothetical protein n=1 Tax=Treponema pectinovorum TaxID=164 RepID=UPI0011F0E9FB|nr:hypothetical protein [Treponema pectinovorum]
MKDSFLRLLNEKKSLSTVYPGIQFPNIAIHSNGGTRNSMAFLDSFNKNIRQYRENVNFSIFYRRFEKNKNQLKQINSINLDIADIVLNAGFMDEVYFDTIKLLTVITKKD